MNQEKKLVRILTCGSVDNGKSTLIGRLMLDAKALMEDQIASVTNSQFSRGDLNLAMFTDGLTEERERGITIDVAYRYFSTPTHKFILADCPGHAEYTRNMATGASNSDIALILVDPNYVLEHGKLEDQTKLHYRICDLFGLNIIFVVNKADTLWWDPDKLEAVEWEINNFTGGGRGTVVNISALTGENVSSKIGELGAIQSPCLMDAILDLADNAADEAANGPLCIAIQHQCRMAPSVGVGNVLSGRASTGDELLLALTRSATQYPYPKTTLVTSALAFSVLGKHVGAVQAGDAIEIAVGRDCNLPRGTVITSPDNPCDRLSASKATLVWMAESSAIPESTRYIFQSHLCASWASIDRIEAVMDPTPGVYRPVGHYFLMTNDIGKVALHFKTPILIPTQKDSPGRKFILIDQYTGDTVAAGFID